MTSRELLAIAVVAAPLLAGVLTAAAPRPAVGAFARGGATLAAAAAVAFAALTLARPAQPWVGRWLVADAAAGLLVGVTGMIGLASVLASRAYLAEPASGGLVRPQRRERTYYALLFAFWALLTAIPLIGNLGGAWLLIEATTAASALLVGFGGKPQALEAAWKYLILTSLGLGFALLGIVVLAAGSSHGGLDALSWRELGHIRPRGGAALAAYLLLLAGLASKIGWAPVHNWLPDAHSEAPAPVSALLSAALLPSVLLIAWRSSQALAPVVGSGAARSVLVGFGLFSLAVAVPFLWRAMPWKRLLAYSSLEHMGVIALGIGFGTPLALAGVALHIAGHAVAKALGFYAATPLLAHEPRAAARQASGIARTEPGLGAVLGLSLGSLAGLPPSPLFASELLIVAGGFAAGRPWTATAAAVLLTLGFLGLAQALLETTIAGSRGRARGTLGGLGTVRLLAAVAVPLLLALSAAAFWLPGSALARALVRRRPLSASYRNRVEAALARGCRFGCLYAVEGGSRVRVVFVRDDGAVELESVSAEGRSVPTIVDLVPAAGWDEREAADLYALSFEGHSPLRPLLHHDAELERWTVAVRGADAYQVAVGPIHAGVIESGHFRFHVVGDRILQLDARLFYKHRGLEAPRKVTASSRRPASPAVPAPPARSQHARLRAGMRGGARAPRRRRARTRTHASARARAHLEPPQRHRGGVLRNRPRGREARSSRRSPNVHAGSTRRSQATASCSGAIQVGASSLRLDATAPRAPAPSSSDLGGAAHRLARSALQRLLPGQACPASGCSARSARGHSERLGRPRASGRRRGRPHQRHRARLRRLRADLAATDARRCPGRGSSSGRSSCCSPSSCLPSCSRGRSSLPARPRAASPRRSASPASRARAVRRSVPSSTPAGSSSGCIYAAAPTRTGRCSRRSLPATSCPTSRSSTRASSSATPARTAEMLSLLRQLRQLRRELALPAPAHARSLTVRHVDAGSCNGCEHELTLASSPYPDLARFGFGIVASPRHADVLLVTGTVTTRMRAPLLAAYAAMPEPRRVVALGDCALGRGVLASASELVGPVESVLPVTARIPGCPPSPATITAALVALADGVAEPTADTAANPPV